MVLASMHSVPASAIQEPPLKKCKGAALSFLSSLLEKTGQKMLPASPELALGQSDVSRKPSGPCVMGATTAALLRPGERVRPGGKARQLPPPRSRVDACPRRARTWAPSSHQRWHNAGVSPAPSHGSLEPGAVREPAPAAPWLQRV